MEVCFGLPGVHNLALWEVLRHSPIRLVGVRHEQAAAYAADGYARATGRLGVALTTTGPGAANTLGAVGEAWASRSPILVIATDIPTTLRRAGVYRGVLHETEDQADMFGPVDARFVVRAADEVGEAVAGAVGAAVRRPVYLEVPTDLLSAEAPAAPPPARVRPRADRLARGEPAALAAAERPLVWAAAGARDAAGEVAALAAHLGAPVLTTYGGRGVAARPSVRRRLPPHAPAAGRAVGRGRPRRRRRLGPRRHEHAELGHAAAARARRRQRGRRGRRQELPRSTMSWRPTRPRAAALTARATREPCGAPARPCAPRPARRSTPRAALPRRLLPRRAGRRGRGVRHVHPGLLDGRLPRFRDRAGCSTRSAGARSASASPPGWAPRWRVAARPSRCRGRWVPVRLRRAGHRRPGAAPADRGDRRRRRLRDAALRSGPAGAEPYGVDLVTPDFEAMAAAFGVRAETVEGLDDAFGEALASTSPTRAERARGARGGAGAAAHDVAELDRKAGLGRPAGGAAQQFGSPYCSLSIRFQPANTAGSTDPLAFCRW